MTRPGCLNVATPPSSIVIMNATRRGKSAVGVGIRSPKRTGVRQHSLSRLRLLCPPFRLPSGVIQQWVYSKCYSRVAWESERNIMSTSTSTCSSFRRDSPSFCDRFIMASATTPHNLSTERELDVYDSTTCSQDTFATA